MRIVFVCTANICRSVMSEAILKKMLRDKQLDKKILVESAGTESPVGRETSEIIKKLCKAYGSDVSHHRSRQLTKPIIETATLVICLAKNHEEVIRGAFPEFKSKVVLLKEFEQLNVPKDPSVADPIGMAEKQYVACFKEIENEIKRVLPALEHRLHNAQPARR